MHRTTIEELCPYNEEVAKSKRRDLLEPLKEGKEKAKIFGTFVKESQWTTSMNIMSTQIVRLGLEPSIADVDYKQSVLSGFF